MQIEETPNVTTNLLPKHDGVGVNTIEIEGELKKSLKYICCIDESAEMVAMLSVIRGNKTKPLLIKGSTSKPKVKEGNPGKIQVKRAALVQIKAVKQIKVKSLKEVLWNYSTQKDDTVAMVRKENLLYIPSKFIKK